jgi:hypothetical protein
MAIETTNQPRPTLVFEKAVKFAADLLTGFLRLARYAYLIRVPIFIGGTLFFFPFAALLPSSPLRSLFQNLFLMGPWPTFWSTIAALVLAWSVLLTFRIILLNCGDRFNVPPWMTVANLSGRAVFGILVLALPAIAGQFTQRGDFGKDMEGKRVFAIVAAALCSYLLAYFAIWFAVVLAPPKTQESALTFPCFRFMRNWLGWADEHHVLPDRLHLGLWIRQHLPCSLWSGYLANDGFMWSGHWLALLFGIATLVPYYLIYMLHGRSLGKVVEVTALTFVLVLLLNANWVLSFISFFLDRFRIPLLVPLALFAIISGNNRSSDYYFHLQPPSAGSKAVFPGDVLRARVGKRIVVIATAGGGIQAAAWTTKVLAGLEDQYSQWKPGESFAENVTLISSVSGGATGSMFYLNLYDPTQPHHFRAGELPGLLDVTSQSSLDDVAWALVYHDLPRIFFWPGKKLDDRGNILEESWRNRIKLDSTLSEWRTGVEQGWRPATIFNSTITETGEPLTFSTTAWKPEVDLNGNPITPRRNNFSYDKYQGRDLRVVSAVRLAATFPYVTPASRPDTPDLDDFHMIDGGYYDNYGISSLIAWLEEGLRDLRGECERKAGADREKKTACQKEALPPILVLQIRSFPPDQTAKATKKGWAFQIYAPIKGLLSVRSTAQLVRGREALSMFARRWEPAEAETPQAKIQFATFEFGGFTEAAKDKATNPPLSWAMNPSQIQAVKKDWESRVNKENPTKNDPNVNKVHCFIDPSFTGCANLSRKPE